MIPSAAPSTGAGALLERNAELSMLAESLEAVERSARGRVLLVGGEAGVGKTTLLRHFLEERGRSSASRPRPPPARPRSAPTARRPRSTRAPSGSATG